MHKIIPYNPKLKASAFKLRKDMTFGEVLLWNQLKDDQLWGFDFDRQRCIDNFIVDFYCKKLMLAIEIDGIYHTYGEVIVKDEIRQKKLESFGIIFLRFTESEVRHDMQNVIRAIEGTVIGVLKKNRDIILPKNFDTALLDD